MPKETSIYIKPAGWFDGFFVHWVERCEGMRVRFSYQGHQGIKQIDFVTMINQTHSHLLLAECQQIAEHAARFAEAMAS